MDARRARAPAGKAQARRHWRAGDDVASQDAIPLHRVPLVRATTDRLFLVHERFSPLQVQGQVLITVAAVVENSCHQILI